MDHIVFTMSKLQHIILEFYRRLLIILIFFKKKGIQFKLFFNVNIMIKNVNYFIEFFIKLYFYLSLCKNYYTYHNIVYTNEKCY